MSFIESAKNKLQTLRELYLKIPVVLAEGEVVLAEDAMFSNQIQNERRQDRRDKALARAKSILRDVVQGLDELRSEVLKESRKTRFPLSSANSPTKLESGRYADAKCHRIVQGCVATGDEVALRRAFDEAKIQEDVEEWSWLALWTALLWTDRSPAKFAVVLDCLNEHSTFTQKPSFDFLLQGIENLKASCMGDENLMATNPALMKPTNFQEWEQSVRLRSN